MSTIIARTYSGAIDLYHGIPNLLNATVVDIEYGDSEECETILVLKGVNDNLHRITIKRQ